VPQFKVVEVDRSVTPFAGDASVGASGASGMLVKLQVSDHALVPSVFLAFTRQ
jgi:hypothetical protein